MTGGALLLAAALLVWPAGAATMRLRGLAANPDPVAVPGAPELWRVVERLPVTVVVPAAAAVVALLIGGPLHACAAAILAATGVDLRRRAGQRRGELAAFAGWERALDEASSALRAGAGPGTALRRAAEAAVSADVEVAAVLTAASAHADLGGEVSAAFQVWRADGAGGSTEGNPAPGGRDQRPMVERIAVELAGAWLLATRHGVVLADVVDGLRADVASRRERALRVDATLAGPRATAAILTCLPLFGVLLGSGFGADPLGVLVDGQLGGALCLVGAMFLSAGLLWTDRIAGGAAR